MSLIFTILEFLWPTAEPTPTETTEAYERLDEAVRRLRELMPEESDGSENSRQG